MSRASRGDAVAIAQGRVAPPHLDPTADAPSAASRAKPARRRFRLLVIGTDVLLLAVALYAANHLRGDWSLWSPEALEPGFPTLWLTHGPWLLLTWIGWLAARGSYSDRLGVVGGEEYNRVFIGSMLAAGTVAMVCYLTKYDLSRGWVCLSFILGTALLFLGRFSLRRLLQRLHARGAMQHRVILIADSAAAALLSDTLVRESQLGYTVVGVCSSGPGPGPEVERADAALAAPVLGPASEIRSIALSSCADAVLVASGPFTDAVDVRRIAWALEGTDIDLIVAPSLTDVAGPRVHVRPVAGLPLLYVEQPQYSAALRWEKRAFDLVMSSLMLLLGLPLWLAVALVVKLSDGGPVLFAQQRVGLGGRLFPCLKFRSMSPDAESRLDALAAFNESDGPLFKIRDDPRVTRIGSFLRRFSLDEVPQLINVLRGDMSLVGPRPPLPLEVDAYGEDVGRRLLVRPGLTGLWQVSGRATLSWRDSVRLDLYYVDNWSLMQDMLILARTVRAVLRQDGAY